MAKSQEVLGETQGRTGVHGVGRITKNMVEIYLSALSFNLHTGRVKTSGVFCFVKDKLSLLSFLSMTVCQKKNRQACNDSNHASGDSLRRKNARLPKPAQRLACAAFLKVRTNGLAK